VVELSGLAVLSAAFARRPMADRMLVNWEDRNPVRFRLQKEGGELGPEMYFSMTPIRSYWADNLEANSKVQVMTIAQNSGRAQISQFTLKPAEPLSGAFRQDNSVPLNKTDKGAPGMLWADDAARWPARPARGRTGADRFPLLQERTDRFGPRKAFSTLANQRPGGGGLDGDGSAGDFLLSDDERRRRDERMKNAASHVDPGGREAGRDGHRRVTAAQNRRWHPTEDAEQHALVTRTADGRTGRKADEVPDATDRARVPTPTGRPHGFG
jgi:hypothetical protein